MNTETTNPTTEYPVNAARLSVDCEAYKALIATDKDGKGIGGGTYRTNQPAAILQAALARAVAKGEDHANQLAAFPVAVAGKGVASVAAVIAGFTLCDAGDAGYTLAVTRTKAKEGQTGQAIALAIYPAYSIDALFTNPQGKAWLDTMAAVALDATAKRTLRISDKNPLLTVDDLENAAKQIPVAMDDYTAVTERGGALGIMATFTSDWKKFTDALKRRAEAVGGADMALHKIIAGAGLTGLKAYNALRASDYAAYHFPTLEEKGYFANQISAKFKAFIAAMNGKAAAEGNPELALNNTPESVDLLLASRDSVALMAANAITDADFDALDALDGEAWG